MSRAHASAAPAVSGRYCAAPLWPSNGGFVRAVRRMTMCGHCLPTFDQTQRQLTKLHWDLAHLLALGQFCC
jgi:hypothetical protein